MDSRRKYAAAPEKVKFICEGIPTFRSAAPHWMIAGQGMGYIVPGPEDAGDRIFVTK